LKVEGLELRDRKAGQQEGGRAGKPDCRKSGFLVVWLSGLPALMTLKQGR